MDKLPHLNLKNDLILIAILKLLKRLICFGNVIEFRSIEFRNKIIVLICFVLF